MTADYVYLTIAEAIEMQRELINEFGGFHGIRDRGALEAAMFRPQMGYYNSITEEAAGLMESLVNNNAFIDGNKRVGFAASDTFLRANNFYLEVDPIAAYNFIVEANVQGGISLRANPGVDFRQIRPV